MKVLLFEDNDVKFDAISNVLIEKNITPNNIIRICTVAEYASVFSKNFDLCIIDIRMPSLNGTSANNAGSEILSMLAYSGKNKVPILAITAFPEDADQFRETFSAHGCMIYDFDQKHVWSQALDIFISQARDRNKYDFLVFTALGEERDPYAKLENLKISSVEREGIDHWECDAGEYSGSIILLPRMGLVNATAIVAKVLNCYSPQVVAMSGICGGIGNNANLGQLLVTDLCWEYQSGKWLDEVHKAEPYQVNIPQHTRISIVKRLESTSLLTELETGYNGKNRPPIKSDPILTIFSSGSAVIASEKRLNNLEQQHRKVAGIDMEIYGFHRAVELSGQNLHAFSSKVVVDKANNKKKDDLHEYGSYISAKFTMEMIAELISMKK
ncbi:response regulator receiver protein [Pseudochrobactrum lubricantis]|uniref:response regulator receiver protein n=1 Tax=Pseudochrobactrum lubricantis TaxID=558172 RepID=UPI0035D71C41